MKVLSIVHGVVGPSEDPTPDRRPEPATHAELSPQRRKGWSMRSRAILLVLAALLACGALGPPRAAADIVCPDSSYATVQFTRSFTGIYRNGQPYDVVTVGPAGVESFAEVGIVIQVYLKNCAGSPLVGVPRQGIVLFNSNLCICPVGNIADAATDANGATSFSGAMLSGGCVTTLSVFADGVFIATLPIKTNSPDAIPQSPCFVDAADLAAFMSVYGTENGLHPNYTICKD